MTTPDADVLLGWALLAVLNAADLRGVPTGQGSEVAAGEASVSAQVAQSVAEGFPRLMNAAGQASRSAWPVLVMRNAVVLIANVFGKRLGDDPHPANSSASTDGHLNSPEPGPVVV